MEKIIENNLRSLSIYREYFYYLLRREWERCAMIKDKLGETKQVGMYKVLGRIAS